MLEKVPHGLGEALAGVRAGIDKTVYEQFEALPATLTIESPAFGEGEPLPPACTADGPGTSPPLRWSNVPEGARELVLIVEDPDAPVPQPMVHAIALALSPANGGLDEGALSGGGGAVQIGKNSRMKAGWLPPDPPNGHGPHRYCFQLFALGAPSGLADGPGRGAVVDAIEKHGIARGRLIGTYRRG